MKINFLLFLNFKLISTFQSTKVKIWINVFSGIALGLAVLITALVWIPKLFEKLGLLVGILVWFCMVSILYAFVPMIGKNTFQYHYSLLDA